MQGPITFIFLFRPVFWGNGCCMAARRFEPPCSPDADLEPGRSLVRSAIFPPGTFVDPLMMAAVMVAMSSAFCVCARLQVRHSHFRFLFFVHVAFLICFGLCQLRRIFVVSTHSRPSYDHRSCQEIFRRSSYALPRFG